ncbi:MAG: guanitoxin biosynthesis MATE family efflux transporter GntT [Microcoleus sp.]
MPRYSASQPKNPSFYRRFFRLAFFNILSNLIVPLAGLIDLAFLGHLGDIRYFTGVALATILFDYIYWTFGFLRMGTTGTTAQAAGRADAEGVLLTGLRNGLLALGLGLAILVLQHPLREIGFTLLTAAPDVKASGQSYYNAWIWGAPATLINYVLIGWFVGREQGGRTLLLSAVANGTNIMLDYLFIVRWGWESSGAGAATAIGQYLMLAVGLTLVYSEGWFGKIPSVAARIFDNKELLASFTLNGDILVRTLALISTFALFTNLSSTLGTVVLATNTLLLQAVSLAAYFIDGIAFATESLGAVFQGQSQSDSLRDSCASHKASLMQLSGGTSLGFGLLFAIAFILFPKPIFGMLTDHVEVIERVNNYVLWLLPVLGFASVAYMLDGYFLGLTEGAVLRKSMIVAALVGFAPTATVAWQLQNNHVLWLALSLFMAARALMLGRQAMISVIKGH